MPSPTSWCSSSTPLILFNVFGWMVPKWRKWNLLTLGLTIFSWVVMGFWKGMGYCICTDIHWQVREAMGIHETADSYLVLLVRNLTGWNPPVELVNNVALVVLVISVIGSLYMNKKDFQKNRASLNANAS